MTRSIATTFALFLVLSGPVHAVAQSQQPAPPQSVESPRPQAAVQAPAQHGFDQYAIGAAAANVLWVPVKAAVCGISAGAGAMAFVLSLGAMRGWTASAFSEGCLENWLLTGADFRPLP